MRSRRLIQAIYLVSRRAKLTALLPAVLGTACLLLLAAPAGAQSVAADLVLQNATVFDGTGAAPTQTDIAIRDDRIVAIGPFRKTGNEWVIDCSGMVISPGFIDLHNHSDTKVVKRSHRAVVNYLMQGCTTIVTGNCGSGSIDVAAYFKKIEGAGVGPNVIHLIPQGKLRNEVIGKVRRKATAEEMNRMVQLAETAMNDGAWGMSTGLIYVPSSYADTEELTQIASVVARHGGIYASHIRNESTRLLASVTEAISIGRNSGCPVHISHFKSSGRNAWGLVRVAAKQIQAARDSGLTVTADQYPYVASSTSLRATLLPSKLREGGVSELARRLRDESTRQTIVQEVQSSLKKRDDGKAVRLARFSHRPDWVGLSIAAIAEKENRPAVDIVLEVFQNGDAQIVNFSMNEDDVRHIMKIDWVATASDGSAQIPGSDKPHPRNYGTFPRKIGHYAISEGVISQAAAIRSATGLPAKILKLKDRGTIKVGHFAGVVVYDPKSFKDAATFDDPHQYSVGIKHVFVNGEAAVFNGQVTGNRPGKVLRHGRAKVATQQKRTD